MTNHDQRRLRLTLCTDWLQKGRLKFSQDFRLHTGSSHHTIFGSEKKNRIILILQICIKAEIAQVSTFFANRFPYLRNFVRKKMEIEITKTIMSSISTFKTDITIVALVFSIFNFLREGNMFEKKNSYLHNIGFKLICTM